MMTSIPLNQAPTLTEEPEKMTSEEEGGGGTESTKGSPPHFSRSLSSANFSPNGDLYDSLDEDWSMSYGTGELSLFDFLDSFSVVPSTLDKLNQRLKLQSKEVPLNPPPRASLSVHSYPLLSLFAGSNVSSEND